MLKFSEIIEFCKGKFRKIPILKEFAWFEWFEWFDPSPIEPFNPGARGRWLGRPRRPHVRRCFPRHVHTTGGDQRGASDPAGVGGMLLVSANFGRLVLGCIEANFCKQMCV